PPAPEDVAHFFFGGGLSPKQARAHALCVVSQASQVLPVQASLHDCQSFTQASTHSAPRGRTGAEAEGFGAGPASGFVSSTMVAGGGAYALDGIGAVMTFFRTPPPGAASMSASSVGDCGA